MDIEAAMLTADLNNDREAEERYAAALARAAEEGFSGTVQGPTIWATNSTRLAPVEVFRDGKVVDRFVHYLDD